MSPELASYAQHELNACVMAFIVYLCVARAARRASRLIAADLIPPLQAQDKLARLPRCDFGVRPGIGENQHLRHRWHRYTYFCGARH